MKRAPADRRSPFVIVEGSFTGPIDPPWVGTLRSVARGADPIKWRHVQALVLCGTGSDAMAVRNGLSASTIVIVDPMSWLRHVDLTWLGRGDLPPVTQWYDDPRLRGVRRRLDRMVGEILVRSSGAGRIHWLLVGPLATLSGVGVDLGDTYSGEGVSSAAIYDELGGSLLKVTRFAAKCTTLLTHEDDPDLAPNGLAGVRELVARLRFADGADILNRSRLQALAERQIVFDKGHGDVIEAVARLQRRAQRRLELYDPYLGLSARPGGYVKPGDDREHLRLQLADIAAGWANDLLKSRGLVETARTFRLVMYNGEQLDADEARRLDQERAFHERLIASAGTSR